MYLCVCNAVSDRDIRRCIDQGVDNLARIKRHCHFQRNCGSCSRYIQAMIDEQHQPTPDGVIHESREQSN